MAAPCVLPLLPVIVGGSLLESAKDKPQKKWLRPVVIASSLAVSVIVCTLFIKATTLLLSVPQQVWQYTSGAIVFLLGVHYLWPRGWELVSSRFSAQQNSNRLLGRAYQKKGLGGAVLVGMALGPVFSSCSPTYALIVAGILPASFFRGLIYLISYALGMSATLLIIALLGQVFTEKFRWLANPNGWFKRIIGTLFVIVAVMVVFGLDKKIQAYVLEKGWYDPISGLEERLNR